MPPRSKTEGWWRFFGPVCQYVWTFNLANNFRTVSAKSFDISRKFPLWQDLVVTNIFDYVALTFEFGLLTENVNLLNNFSTVIARASTFHMSITSDKTFPWIPIFFYL